MKGTPLGIKTTTVNKMIYGNGLEGNLRIVTGRMDTLVIITE